MVMMASGQNGQSFAFNGYIPVKEPERGKALKALERRAMQEHQAQIFIEAPYRNVKLFDTLRKTLSPKMRLTVAADITAKDELIVTRTIEEWQRSEVPNIEKRPTIFVLGI
jgi:16S rRNA (cytidine1402-2'-O)-methyltransferase